MKFIVSIIFVFFSFNCFAQKSDSNSIVVHKDPRLDLLVKKQAEINKTTGLESKKTDKGYRLLIISTNNRDEAVAAKTKIYKNFPSLKAYLWYQSPYFRVKAGNFKDRDVAASYQRRLNIYFPNGVFIMKDVIEMKKGKGLNDETD